MYCISQNKWEDLTVVDNFRIAANHCYESGALSPLMRKWSRFHSVWTSCLLSATPNAPIPAVRNPPAFPPFLHVMKTRGEDIRPSISEVHFTYALMNLCSCAEPCALKGSCCRALSAFLRGRRQWNHTGYQALTGNALTQTADTSVSDRVILWGAHSALSCFCGVSFMLTGGLPWDWQEGFL